VPWELPIKRKIMDAIEYDQKMKDIQNQKMQFDNLASQEREVVEEKYAVLKFEEEEEKGIDKCNSNL
jgi:hypothetical protein